MAETKTVTLREGLVVEIKELNARESMAANRYVPAGMDPRSLGFALQLGQINAICAVRKINDQFVDPSKSDLDYDRVVDAMTQRDLVLLGSAYNDLFEIATDEASLKNSSTDPSSDT